MSRLHAFTVFLLATCVPAVVPSENQDQPRVALKDGSELLGVFKEFHSEELPARGKVEAFFGIPYAKPPSGPLRFRPPVAFGQLSSPFDATEIGRSCIQPDVNITNFDFNTNPEMSEDCLFLDVLVPHPRPKKAAVLFSIHGGGYTSGAGNLRLASMKPLVVYGDVIVVTINYRLGLFGFLSTGDEVIPGNMALMDQQLALTWVKENIAAFGGDPSSVTIAGVSAGSASVGFHVLSPGSRGLFRYGIMESGSPFDIWNGFRSAKDTKAEAIALAKLVGCSDQEVEVGGRLLECLQKGTGEELFEKFSKVQEVLSDPARYPPGPVVDGTFLPDVPAVVVEKGPLNGENLIVSTNYEEGTLFSLFTFPDFEVKPVVNATMLGATVSPMYPGTDHPIILELIRTIYAADADDLLDDTREDFFHEAIQFLGDRFFFCSESRFARKMSDTMDVYRATMTYVPSQNFMGVKWAGAAHGDEAQYVLGALFEEGNPLAETARDEEKDMSRLAMSYWLNFIKTGNPNTKTTKVNELPEWRKFTREDEIFKDLTPAMGDLYMKKRECYFQDNVLPPLKEALDELKKLRAKTDEHSKWTKEGQCEGESCDRDDSSGGTHGGEP